MHRQLRREARHNQLRQNQGRIRPYDTEAYQAVARDVHVCREAREVRLQAQDGQLRSELVSATSSL
ncbi:hypothetical protein WJM95_29180 [Streptomyces sp. f51]|uniref:hypothetical protein n=1 Tax=Streptomyces sp. f51 TaxID=1827742 RepID=UPI0030D133D9